MRRQSGSRALRFQHRWGHLQDALGGVVGNDRHEGAECGLRHMTDRQLLHEVLQKSRLEGHELNPYRP
eukprot:4220610-Pleurochrysis_carterae.AAC.1